MIFTRLSILYFNSHAHVERDGIKLLDQLEYMISTHTLTWSVTGLTYGGALCRTFQLTRSRGA